jgi:hypothetical protein
MTDRHGGYLVVLADNVRDDDTAIAAALGMVKGVLHVVPVPADVRQHIADERARGEPAHAAFRRALATHVTPVVVPWAGRRASAGT